MTLHSAFSISHRRRRLSVTLVVFIVIFIVLVIIAI
jgi:hypothetical protein